MTYLCQAHLRQCHVCMTWTDDAHISMHKQTNFAMVAQRHKASNRRGNAAPVSDWPAYQKMKNRKRRRAQISRIKLGITFGFKCS